MVKPSPIITYSRVTPYKLCLLDQFFGLTYVPQVLFYGNTALITSQSSFICDLRESLSKALSLYFPLAGRLGKTDDDISTIVCNDEGVSFVVARIDCSLDEYIRHESRVDVVNEFLPAIATIDFESNNSPLDWSELVLLAIQVTEFSCGGVGIGSQYLHKVFDGASWTNFLKTWAAFAARRDEDIITPDFTTAVSVFPPCQWAEALSSSKRPVPLTVRSLGGTDNDNSSEPTCVGKAFVFSANSISALQAKGTSADVPNPTRVEAISGFIWKHAITAAAATASAHGLDSNLLSGKSVLIHSVNMRPRTDPPLPSTSIGNLITHAIAYINWEKYEPLEPKSNLDLSDLVAQVRKGLSEAKNPEFLNKFIGAEGSEVVRAFKQKLADINKDTNTSTYKFTSWSKLDVFPDFGFGMPVWIGFAGGRLSTSLRNLVVLIENPNRLEIEAWLILDEREMDCLESDPEFVEFGIPTV
ncbi:hypothetical protein vseg_016322 [Gypsophila vaccaria]